jgi:hypothetical protein
LLTATHRSLLLLLARGRHGRRDPDRLLRHTESGLTTSSYLLPVHRLDPMDAPLSQVDGGKVTSSAAACPVVGWRIRVNLPSASGHVEAEDVRVE